MEGILAYKTESGHQREVELKCEKKYVGFI